MEKCAIWIGLAILLSSCGGGGSGPGKVSQFLNFSKSSANVAWVSGGSTYSENPLIGVSGSGLTTFSSSDVAVASVNEVTGMVTFLNPGITVITARNPGDDQHYSGSASYTFTVRKADQALVFITQSASSAFTVGGKYPGNTLSGARGTGNTTFESSDISISTVDVETGVVNFVSLGTVVITATNPGDSYYNSDSASYEFKTSVMPVAKDAKFEHDLMPRDISTKCGTLSATDEEGDTLTYVIVSNGSLGAATFSKPTESLVCYSTNSGLVSAGLDSFTYKVSDGVSDSNIATVQWELHTDPLYIHQWHLENKGQSNFASSNGIADEDIQVTGPISSGYTGKSVTVAVIDSGLEIDHEDLSPNVVPGGSYNFVDNGSDPTSSSSSGDHGTAVAGLIGSRGWNDLGGRGVAPKVSLKGFNFLKKPSMANHIAALGGGEYAKDVDIFNMSYGSRADFDRRINSALEAQLKNGITVLRETKGALYVKSAGNGFNSFKKEDGKTVRTNCKSANAAGISCQNANMDPGATTPYTIIVGALNADGVKTHYSTAGANIWVSAPGGSGGYDMNHTALSCGESCAPYLSKPAMMSTDQMSCEKGLVRSQNGKGRNPFQDGSGNHPLNPSCNYTSRMNGTSASAPVVSGSLALILEANPDLTWRDVKHILATTAVLVDSERTATMVTLGDGAYAAEEGWTTNAAGFRFHNWYGFGALDVSAAIESSKTYMADQLGPFLESTWVGWQSLSGEIPDNSSSGYVKKLNILGSMVKNISVIEAVQLKVSASHSSSGDLGFELVSPSGTKSIPFNITNGFSETDNLNNMVLLSNAFYGESPFGEWMIKVVDGGEGVSGVLTSAHLKFFGRSVN